MKAPLQSRIDFSPTDAASSATTPLQSSQYFDQQAYQAEMLTAPYDDELGLAEQEQQQNSLLLQQIFHPPRSWWRRWWKLGLLLMSVAAIAQAVQWFIAVWQQQQWIALTFAIAILVLMLSALSAFVIEAIRTWRLRQRYDERQQAQQLMQSLALGNAKPFCEKLLAQSALPTSHAAVQHWYQQLHDSQNDSEVMQLYASEVQTVLDRQAQQLISYYAAESALMIAISPLALVDMLFIAWRNLRLINQLAKLYRLPLGYFSRLALFKMVMVNIAFAGASELVREVGLDWLSQDITARLSARAAQGIGAGLLTARLGIKAMELCRPLPWRADEKPRLADFRRSLYQQVKTVFNKSSPDKTGS